MAGLIFLKYLKSNIVQIRRKVILKRMFFYELYIYICMCVCVCVCVCHVYVYILLGEKSPFNIIHAHTLQDSV